MLILNQLFEYIHFTTLLLLTREVVVKPYVKLIPLVVIVLPGFSQASCYDLLLYGLQPVCEASLGYPWGENKVRNCVYMVLHFRRLDGSVKISWSVAIHQALSYQ